MFSSKEEIWVLGVKGPVIRLSAAIAPEVSSVFHAGQFYYFTNVQDELYPAVGSGG